MNIPYQEECVIAVGRKFAVRANAHMTGSIVGKRFYVDAPVARWRAFLRVLIVSRFGFWMDNVYFPGHSIKMVEIIPMEISRG